MREIGGYIELDKQDGSLYHDNAVALNCGRAALEYLIRIKDIKTIWIPYFCCDSISQPCNKLNVTIHYYHVGYDFLPELPQELQEDDWLYIVNYYGQLSNKKLFEYKSLHNNLIVDNAQAYFQMPLDGIDTLYTCRKYFGVSDGAFLYTNKLLDDMPQDYSYERIHYILGRFEKTAGEFYAESSKNNQIFELEPVKRMSKLTENLLRSIDYDKVMMQRTDNFRYLQKEFNEVNRLQLAIPDGAFMYPLYVKNAENIKKKLQSEKIFIPTLWPDVLEHCGYGCVEYDMAANILPLPIDQRYGLNEMQFIVKEIKKWLN